MQTRVEYLRTRHGQHVASVTDTFIVPRIERFDEQAGLLVFERVHGMLPLDDYLCCNDAPQEMLKHLGAVLAAIHTMEALPELKQAMAGGPPSTQGSAVIVHGDFGSANIFVDRISRRPVIIDWSLAHWLPGNPLELWQSPSIDLSLMLVNLFYSRPFLRKPAVPAEALAVAFLGEYAKRLPGVWDSSLLRRVLPDLARQHAAFRRQCSGLLHALAYRHSVGRVERFVEKEL